MSLIPDEVNIFYLIRYVAFNEDLSARYIEDIKREELGHR